MTKDEALRLALEAMEYADACLKKQLTTKEKHEHAQDLLMEAGTAIKAALEAKDEPDYKALWQQMCERCDELDKKLAQQEHEPVVFNTLASLKHKKTVGPIESAMSNTTPPQRTWVGLSNEDKKSFWTADQMTQEEWDELFSAIEAKLKQKNFKE
jgi:hypothetical protein